MTSRDLAAGPRLVVGVVPRGEADRHVGAAIRAGAQAATVFPGRSLDSKGEVGASGLSLHAEKEIIVTVVDSHLADAVVRAMARECSTGSGSTGYIAKLPVARVVGLLEAVTMSMPNLPEGA
jgi:hypothetical protein